jgi:hypothetical protein
MSKYKYMGASPNPPMSLTDSESTPCARKWHGVAKLLVTCGGIALMVCAVGANQRWLDKHFLPSFVIPRSWYVRIEMLVRLSLAASGALLVTARHLLARVVARSPAMSLQLLLAVVLALGIAEPVLHRFHLQPSEWLDPEEEPRRRVDSRLGWTFIANRIGHNTISGREIEYVIDPSGYRVARPDSAVDFRRPTILFTGESVMCGEGLRWEETIPAQVGAPLNTQSANLAVHGYATDQAFLRLQKELPRFEHPVAVVSLFMTEVFNRNLDRDRPHLNAGLRWAPSVERWRLAVLADLFVPYRSDDAIDEGVRMTTDVLRATVQLARARDATPLIVMPQFGNEDAREVILQHRIFDGAGLPVEVVPLDATWRIPWDRHPDARAAHAIASAIVRRLQSVTK